MTLFVFSNPESIGKLARPSTISFGAKKSGSLFK